MNTVVLLPVLLPVIIGLGILIGKEPKKKSVLFVIVGLGLGILLVLFLPTVGWLFFIGIVVILVGILWLLC